MRKHLLLLLFAGLCAIPSQVYAQLSPSGQMKVITPSILSACAADTIWVELTNKNGPTCTGGGSAVPDAQLAITIPGTGEITYQSGTVDGGGATEVSYTSNVLTMDIPVPAFGTTTRSWFVLNSTCEVTSVDPLPSLSLSATYPAAMNTTPETWNSAQMNTGIGQINFVQSSSTQNSITGAFGETTNTASYVTNTGFGKITKLVYHQIVHDSLVPYLGSTGKDHIYTRKVRDANGTLTSAESPPYSNKYDTYPEGQLTNLGNGYREYSAAFEGVFLDNQDGSFDPGDQIQINAGYFRFPTTCLDDMLQKQWITYECVGGSTPCNVSVDTLTRVYRLSAGTPIVSGLNSSVEAWDGCTNKNASFTFKNSGIPSPTDSNVSVAFDVDLGLSLGGKMFIDNLTLGGVSVTTTPTTPGSVSKISWNLKDQNTVDFDGPGGIEDLDNDGFYDDIRPGDSVNVAFTYSVDSSAACGANLDYSIAATSSFTDYCRKLNGSGSTNIYEFGFRQTAPVAQVTPVPDYGTMTASQIETRQADFTFNYQGVNLDVSNAVAKLRINYSSTMTIKEPIVFLGTTIPLASFTQIGTGGLDTIGYANTTDVDSALEYTLSPAEIATLLDNTGDDLSYWVSHISCDSFQTQTNNDGFQILFQMSSSPCPSPNTAPPAFVDLACNAPFGYNIAEGCGNKPCYNVTDSIYRTAITGYNDEEETTAVVPTAAGTSKFYEGDTLTFLRTAQLSSDYLFMEPIGTFAGNGYNDGFVSAFSFHYNKPVGLPMTSIDKSLFEFIPTVSRLRIYDTTTNTLLHDIPLEFHHFAAVSGTSGKGGGNRNSNLYLWNNTTDNPAYAGQPNTNSTPGIGLGDYWCGTGSHPQDPSACPYLDARYRSIPSITYGVMSNEADNRISERFALMVEDAMIEGNVTINPGYAKYYYEIDTKWRVNPDWPIDNISSLREIGNFGRDANNITPRPGTKMATCGGDKQALATPVTKELVVEDGGRSYDATCGLTIENKLFFNSPAGDFFPGEVRVPFKMDSFVVDMPKEYYLTAAPTFGGTAGGPINSIQADSLFIDTTMYRNTFTNNTTNSGTTYTDFPRFSDADGLTTVWEVSYPISNVGTDNFITQSYKVPVTYYLRDEMGNASTLIDTFVISESTPAITLTPLGGAVQIEDGGACADSYMDVLVSNNTIYGADKVFIAVESNPNVIVVSVGDAPDETPADPISASDISSYGTNNFYAQIGGMAGGDRRVVRVYFNTTSCGDSLKVLSNFGCNYPTTSQPEYPSTTLDSAFIAFNSVAPGIMSGPIDGNRNIANLCDIQTLEVELRNVKNPNLTNILAGIKLPTNAIYVASSAEIAYPSDDYVAASGVTLTGTDSITIDISADLDLATSCGLNGADESEFTSGVNLGNSSAANVVKFRFNVDFTACPTGTTDAVYYNVSGDNYCGTEVNSKGVFNLIYVGSNTPNTFSCQSANGSPLQVCADAGIASSVVDSIWVKNETGPATTGIGSTMEIIVANDTALFDVANYSAAAPWAAPTVTTNSEGRSVLIFTVPASIAPGDSTLLVMTYDLTPKVDNVCTQGTTPCAELAHSISFFSETLVDCAAKSLTCSSLGQVSRGTGYVPKSIECCKQTLGDFVWLDEDGDGVQDSTEPGVAGVTVTLYDSLGNIVGTTLTDAYGMYLFDIPVPGNYTVGFTPPPNYTFTSSTGTDDNDSTNSDVNALTGQTGPINIARGEDERDVDAGLIPTTPPAVSSIGDKVWYDTDGDGIQDSTENGVAGVTVTLYDGAGNVVAVTTTDANGNYLFNDLPNGTYSVGFDPLPGTTLTSSTGTTPGDNTDSDADPTTGRTAPIVISAPGTMITGIDAGLIDDPKSSLGDLVWNDLNNDGIQDPGEPGVPGVEMVLWDAGPDGIAGSADDVALDTVLTNANGNYLFTGLDSGAYFVTATPPTGYTASPSDQGTDDFEDSDFTNIGGTQTSQVYNLLNNQDYTGVDLGIYNTTPNLGSLGDKVFLDLDGDGIQDPTEQGLGGVTVSLLDGAGNPVNNPAKGMPYVVQTDPDGNYLFTDLPAGTYQVAFSNLPPDYSFSPQGQGTDSTLNSDVNPGTGTTGPITLGPGEDRTDIDAGVKPFTGNGLGSIGDKVFVDGNNNGVHNPGLGEQGVPGVTVYLYEDTNGDGMISGIEATTPVDSTVTNGQGNYIFTGLPAGNYQVGFDTNSFPAGYSLQPGKNDQGSNDERDSDADPFTGLSPIIPLGQGEERTDIDAGIYNPTATNSIGDFVWLDLDSNGVQDPNEIGVQGVTVNLLDSAGNIIASTVTLSDGSYTFSNLPNGIYRVQMVPLPGMSITTNNGSENGGTDSTNSKFDPSTGLSDPIPLTGNTNVTNVDGGLITDKAALGDKVWIDTDMNGKQDAGEPGVPGVLVKLYRPGFGPDGVPGGGDDNDPIASAITDGDGKYFFPNLDPGTYEVEFSNLPSGFGFTEQNASGTTASNDSDADPTTGRTGPVTLGPGDIDRRLDAGLVPNVPGSVGDYVWFDADMDGIQDADEAGIPGIKVELKDSLGNVIATTFTDGDGGYRFDNVPPGDYSIQFTDPNGGAFTTSGAGNGSDDSDADPTGLTPTFTVNAGEHTPNVDAGITTYVPLPADGLIATRATIQSSSNCSVHWYTLSELNTNYFTIERSVDAVNFLSVGELNASGSTTTKVEYVFNDDIENVTDANVLYYRIRLKDIDGNESVSNIVSAEMKANDVVSVYPNLFDDRFNISMNVKRDAIVNAEITDVTGKTIINQTFNAKQGTNSFSMDQLSSLASGSYYLHLVNRTTSQQFTVKIQRK